MKILVLGGQGQVGRCLHDQLIDPRNEVIFWSRTDLDISNFLNARTKILTLRPDVLINTAAYTAVDKSEVESELANIVNYKAVQNIAEICLLVDAVFIHLSTDYVFDGEATQPYVESSKTNPLGTYGKTKLLGEKAIVHSGCRYIILRTSWVYSEYGNNFFKTMLRIGALNDSVRVVNDEFGCPTYAQDLAKGIQGTFNEIENGSFESGIYHFTGDVVCSWYDFSVKIFSHAKFLGFKGPKSVVAIASKDYVSDTKRPAYSVLDNEKYNGSFARVSSDLDLAISKCLSAYLS